jgi:hypothetical protein
MDENIDERKEIVKGQTNRIKKKELTQGMDIKPLEQIYYQNLFKLYC